MAKALRIALEEITPTSALSGLGADSLEIVEITMAIEEEFPMAVPNAEAGKAFTPETAVQEIVDFVERYRTM